MPTEDEIRKWAREEWEKLDAEKVEAEQAACSHARSGTHMGGGVIKCDDCKKVVTPADYLTGSPEDKEVDVRMVKRN